MGTHYFEADKKIDLTRTAFFSDFALHFGKKMGKKGRGVNQGRGHKTTKRDLKAKNKKKHLDEIDSDLKPKIAESLLNQEIDFDLPGKGQNYCLHCAR